MKRLVEIVGPTPMFVRWAIGMNCDLRASVDGSEPLRVEKQLGAIRAAAEALSENRVLDGIALHARNVEPDCGLEDAVGFFVDEPFQFVGGVEHAKSCCSSCKACLEPTGEWQIANCFGWLRLDLDDEQVNCLKNSVDEVESDWIVVGPGIGDLWCRLFDHPFIDERRSHQLEKAIAGFNRSITKPRHDWVAFEKVLRHCRELQLQLFVELVPAGFSDGVLWTVGPYCPNCKMAQPENEKRCSFCGKPGSAHPIKKRRAKGIRPYLRLTQLVGSRKTAEIVQQMRENFRT